MTKRVNCYIDGFNLYYRLFRNSRRQQSLRHLKWLDLRALCEILAGKAEVHTVYYFTAAISPSPSDPTQHLRQQAYWRALDAADVTRVEGQFRRRTKKGYPRNAKHGSQPVEVETFEEKGSDVNLATCLVRDAFIGAFDEAIVISNDSDLSLAIRTVVQDAGKRVRVVSPDLFVVNDLQNAVRSRQHDAGIIQPRLLNRCQFPDPVASSDGTIIRKPQGW